MTMNKVNSHDTQVIIKAHPVLYGVKTLELARYGVKPNKAEIDKNIMYLM